MVIQTDKPHKARSQNSSFIQQSQHTHQKQRKLYKNQSLLVSLIRACIFLFMITPGLSTEMQIITNPTHQHIKSLNLLKSLRRFRVRYINLLNDTYACITAIRQKPLDLRTSPSPSLYFTSTVPTSSPIHPTLYPSHLDLLADNIGVHHYTKQFIYGYKHKKIVSQFDDDKTVVNNQKKEVENFTMGVYELGLLAEVEKQGKEKKNNQMNVHTYDNDQEKVKKKMESQAINLFDNNFKPLSQRYAHEAHKFSYIDHKNRLITLTQPLQPTPHTKSKTYNITLSCTHTSKPPKNQSIIGISVSNFEVISYTNIPAYCRAVLEIVHVPFWLLSFDPRLNIANNLLVGDLDGMCEDTLEEGDFLMIQTERKAQYKEIKDRGSGSERKKGFYKAGEGMVQYLEIQVDPETGEAIVMKADEQAAELQPVKGKYKQIREFFVAKIIKILGQNVYMTDIELPWTLKPKSCLKISLPSGRTIEYSGQIQAGNKKLLPSYEIPNPKSYKLLQFEVLTQTLIKKPKTPSQISVKLGDEFFCILEKHFAIASTLTQLEYIGITIGKNLGSDYLEIHPWKTMSSLALYLEIVTYRNKMKCTPFVSVNQNYENRQLKYESLMSQMVKMNSQNKNKIKFTTTPQNSPSEPNMKKTSAKQYNQDSILMITMSKDAVVEIQTTVYEQDPIQVNKDDGTSGLEEDMSPATDLYDPSPEPTKKQLAHNKYFANIHKIYKIQTNFINNTKIRLERLENSFYENSTNQNMIIIHKGMWRAGDFVKFPRFLFKGGQKITGLVVKFGTIFVRVIDLSKTDRQIFAVSSSEFLNHVGFGPINRPASTVSTQHKFQWGTFCGGTINKNRQVTAKLRCGQPWFKIKSVVETSPCQYEINILTQFLCDQGVVFPALNQGFNTFNGSMCLPVSFYQEM